MATTTTTTTLAPTSPRPAGNDFDDEGAHARDSGLFRRSWHAMSDLMSPFSAKALASLPRPGARYVRADAIPEVAPGEDGARPTVRDYHAINSLPPNVRVPKKVKTPVRVEPKVWFANERTWVSYLDAAILIGTLALGLFNAAKDNITRYFAYAYALISVGVLVYGYLLYQHRITLIRRRDPGSFDQVLGPVIISIVLFGAVLANFIIRVKDLNRHGVTIPNVLSTAFAIRASP